MSLPSKNALQMFFETARLFPHMVAVELEQQAWTYSELLANVIRVSQYLQIERDEIVYQYVDRSLEMVCGLLGIMCSGGVYCPLNPDNPPTRIRSLLDNMQGRFVLANGRTCDSFLNINTTFPYKKVFK
jgi:iturin family lipopeptide synthetase C